MWTMEKFGKNGFYHPKIHHFNVTNVTNISKLAYGLHLFSTYFISCNLTVKPILGCFFHLTC